MARSACTPGARSMRPPVYLLGFLRVSMDNLNCVPRPNFLCRSIGKVLGMNIITSNIPPLHSYDRCEQIFTLFFCLI